MPTNDDLLHKETPSYARNRGQFYTTIKTQRLSKHKVCIIHPISSTLELWKVFWLNLRRIFGRYHTGNLLGFFFVFVSQVSSKKREYHVAYWRFLVSSVGIVYGKDQEISYIHRFLDKKLHGTYLFDDNNHQQSGQRTATHCLRETSLNPHSNNGMAHQAKSWPRGTIAPKERSDEYLRGRPRRHQC